MRPPYAGLDRLTPVLFVPKWAPPLLFLAAGTPENGISSLLVAKKHQKQTLNFQTREIFFNLKSIYYKWRKFNLGKRTGKRKS